MLAFIHGHVSALPLLLIVAAVVALLFVLLRSEEEPKEARIAELRARLDALEKKP